MSTPFPCGIHEKYTFIGTTSFSKSDIGKNYDAVPEGFPDVAEELLTTLDEDPSETDSETLPETFPMEENDSVPGPDEEREAIQDTSTVAKPQEYSESAARQKAETPEQWDFSKKYLLASIAVSSVLLLVAVVGYIVMYQLLKRDIRAQEDKEATGQDWDSSWESCGLPRVETESAEGSGSGERPQAKRVGDSCPLFPEIFAAELAQLYKNKRADPSPLSTCPFCALADGATSRDYWITLDSPQPTASWCPCCQYQEEYFMLDDED
ncbi:uncharacterized protein LOC132322293 [Haemorhous mexicanus]|uniref:uncharacterized protein LOC132322293 n=2 Tax=Haemorhous mexicanus TaxID=30427 RepID=UPI0028BD50BD|nr:uncharacterized protein LOC132322293 [Haemorhous mexicanus]